MGLVVSWYVVNFGFYFIFLGYGLFWGMVDEEFIFEDFVFEVEFVFV